MRPENSNLNAIDSLRERFKDLVNYQSEDIGEPIDPRTYVSPEGDNILHYAAMRGDIQAVKWSVQIGIDVNSVGDMGQTPAHYARMFGHRDILELLASAGADLTLENEFGDAP